MTIEVFYLERDEQEAGLIRDFLLWQGVNPCLKEVYIDSVIFHNRPSQRPTCLMFTSQGSVVVATGFFELVRYWDTQGLTSI